MRGGKRNNAGRKAKYKEKTITLSFRIPINKVDEIKDIIKSFLQKYVINDTSNET